MKRILIILILNINIVINAFCYNDTIYILPWFDRGVKKIIITDTITGNFILINRRGQWPSSKNILFFDTSAAVLEMRIKKRLSTKEVVVYLPLRGEKSYMNFTHNKRYLYFGIRNMEVYNLYFLDRIRKLF